MVREKYASAGAGSVLFRIWEPEGPAVGVVQLVHGIAEHIGRYAEFGKYLAAHGYAAAAEDHMGHGESVSEDCLTGCVRGGWNAMVQDVHGLTALLKGRYPGLPFFLLGHSMGSFLARTYLYTFPREAPAFEPERTVALQVSRAMIDCNDHVHNVAYLDLFNEALPEDEDMDRFDDLTLVYCREIRPRQRITAVYGRAGEERVIVLKAEDTDQVHAFLLLR